MKCPHRIWMDRYGPQDLKLEANEFVKLLWETGIQHEQKVIEILGSFKNLEKEPYSLRPKLTFEAMRNGEPLIYHGQLILDIGNIRLKGEPDLLKKVSSNPNRYIAVDIKSGIGYEGSEDSEVDEEKLKKHYAVQLCLYTEILQGLNLSAGKYGEIIDINIDSIKYELDRSIGVRTSETFWDFYQRLKLEINQILTNKVETRPAFSSSVCKLCQWYEVCKNWIKEKDDISQIYKLGRSKRDTLINDLGIENVDDLLKLDVQSALEAKNKNKTFLRGIGKTTLDTFVGRTEILKKTKQPVVRKNISFPEVDYELFFDIEADPTQDHVYLHGVWERKIKYKTVVSEKFVNFVANEVSSESEERAWSDFWKYLKNLDGTYSVYYYGSYEKTAYHHLQKKYPEVISSAELDEFFDREETINLYNDIIDRYTDWPLWSYSIKDIAMYLGFKWTDETPSGALSIQWYNEYQKSHDSKQLDRILIYNQDDCKATAVVKDWLSGRTAIGKSELDVSGIG